MLMVYCSFLAWFQTDKDQDIWVICGY